MLPERSLKRTVAHVARALTVVACLVAPQPGAALWSEAVGPHYIHNVGTSELVVIAVELKRK